MTRICYVPQDAAALSVGADHVARAIAAEAERRGIDMTIIRTGSRGLLYLEPLVEIATERGRVAYGPVAPGDVAGLFDSGFPDGADHRLGHGLTEEIPYLKQQERLTFARCGIIDPVSVDDYVAHGGFAGLKRALAISPAEIVKEVTDSGLRGRGGAGFPTGIKWKTVLEAAADQKYICCNADEGDSGTFADRMLMEGDPFTLIEGMTIAAIATGATKGYIYIRSEYPHAIATMKAAIAAAEAQGWLGRDIQRIREGLRSPPPQRRRRLHLRRGDRDAGEPRRQARHRALQAADPGARRPVRQADRHQQRSDLRGSAVDSRPWGQGLCGLSASAARAARCRSSLPATSSTAAWSRRPSASRFAISSMSSAAAPPRGGRPVPFRSAARSAPIFRCRSSILPMDYETFAANEAMVGHGGIVVFDDTVDMAEQARFAMEFCAIESCGKCTPCRIGSTRGVEVIDKILAGIERDRNLQLLDDLCTVMTDGSLCAMGGLTPMPVRSAVKHFPEDFLRPVHAAAAE